MTGVLAITAVVAMVAVAPGVAAADSAEPVPQVKVTRDGATRIVTLDTGEVRVLQTLAPSKLEMRIATTDDALWFTADLQGRVTVERGDERRAFSVRHATLADQAAVRAMVRASTALAALDALLDSSWAQGSAAATVLRTGRDVIRVLDTDYVSVDNIAAARPLTGAAIVPARQRLSPSQCWDTYSRDVVHFTYELQSCIGSVSSQWWNPLATAWCSYEYNLKSSLAAIWLLDCYGAWV